MSCARVRVKELKKDMNQLKHLKHHVESLPSIHNGKRILLDIRYKETNHPKPIIIFVHGFKGFKDWGPFNMLADFFAQNDFVFCKINLSHNGTIAEQPLDFPDLEAFGNNNFSIELDDIGSVIDYLSSGIEEISKFEIDQQKIFLLGHSRGGGMVLLKAAEDNRIKAVATLAAISDLKERWSPDFLQEWKEKGVQYVYNGRTKQNMPLYYQLIEDLEKNFSRLNIPNAVRNLRTPALILHGTDDETLPVSMAHDIKASNPSFELKIIEGANHTFGGYHPYFEEKLPENLLCVAEEIAKFFKKTQHI